MKLNWTEDVIKSGDELKKLIAEHPDLPIVVLAGEEANSGDYSWTYCTSVHFEIIDILTVETPYDSEYAIMDEDELKERIADLMYDDDRFSDEKELDAFIEAEVKKYAPYWRKVIAIYATN